MTCKSLQADRSRINWCTFSLKKHSIIKCSKFVAFCTQIVLSANWLVRDSLADITILDSITLYQKYLKGKVSWDRGWGITRMCYSHFYLCNYIMLVGYSNLFQTVPKLIFQQCYFKLTEVKKNIFAMIIIFRLFFLLTEDIIIWLLYHFVIPVSGCQQSATLE